MSTPFPAINVNVMHIAQQAQGNLRVVSNGLNLDDALDLHVRVLEFRSYRPQLLATSIVNADNNPQILDEVLSLMREIKTAWDAVPQNIGKESSGLLGEAGSNPATSPL